ncbi:hypothetical protein ACFL57_03435 [Candidatus Margulisiibacteriota bacterium]
MFKNILINILIMFVVVSPYIANVLGASTLNNMNIISSLGVVSGNPGVIVNQWGFILSYLLPVILVLLAIIFYCGDYYELFYRFTPIFIMIFIEILVLNFHLIFGVSIQPQLFSTRIGNFFSRYLYFVPVIYFMSSPVKNLYHNIAASKIINSIHDFITRYIVKYRIIISMAGILPIAMTVIFSGINYYHHHEEKIATRMQNVMAKVQEVSAVDNVPGIIVSEDIPVNLLIPVLTKHRSLLVNSFNTYMDKTELIDRMVLFARINNWDQKKLLKFMMPSKFMEEFYRKNNFIVSDEVFYEGFGYWLVWHQRKMDDGQIGIYKELLIEKFSAIDTKAMIEKYNISIL